MQLQSNGILTHVSLYLSSQSNLVVSTTFPLSKSLSSSQYGYQFSFATFRYQLVILDSISQKVWFKAQMQSVVSTVYLPFVWLREKNLGIYNYFPISEWVNIINGFLLNKNSVINFIHVRLSPISLGDSLWPLLKGKGFPPTSTWLLLRTLSPVGGPLCQLTNMPRHASNTVHS